MLKIVENLWAVGDPPELCWVDPLPGGRGLPLHRNPTVAFGLRLQFSALRSWPPVKKNPAHAAASVGVPQRLLLMVVVLVDVCR